MERQGIFGSSFFIRNYQSNLHTEKHLPKWPKIQSWYTNRLPGFGNSFKTRNLEVINFSSNLVKWVGLGAVIASS